MTAQYSPGPWTVKENEVRWDSEVWGNDFRICSCEGNLQKAQANARLIAAAPDLLDTLEALVEFVDESGEWAHFPEIMDARRAIKTAKGE